MSVVGIDPGNDTSCVALARKRGIDVIMNKESKRETPSVVNFGDKMRFLGTDGSSKMALSPQNTVHQLRRIIGKKFSDPQLQQDISKLPFAVVPAPDGGVLVEVMYCNERVSFSPEQLMAIVLVDQKHIAEAEAGITVIDCVISVPTYFNEPERYAMLAAAQIAGLNCLRLINETTATALAYGIYKTDLSETDAVNVAFVDVGHSATQVSVVSLKKNGMQVRSHAWDRNLGGRNFDEALFDHFVAEHLAKTKLDIRTNKKSAFKLRQGVEKLKKMLSANSEAPLNIECILEDTDLRSMLNREQFEEMVAPVLARLKAPIDKALADAGLKASDISSVEIVGSATRTPAVFRIIEEAFGRTPSRTMNSKECVSRGCALQCAMLSPVFKVREFEVVDACPYAVEFRWEREGGGEATQTLFEKNSAVPSAKMLTFLRSAPFTVTAWTPETGDKIGEWAVGPFEPPAGADKAKLKVKVRMNLHGIIAVESIQSIEEEEVGAAAAPAEEAAKDAKMEEATADPSVTAAESSAGDAGAAAPMDTEAPVGPPKPDEEKKKKAKVKKHDVPFQAKALPLVRSAKEVEAFFEREHQMQAADRLQEETNERKNALEGYVYSLRNRLYDTLAPYIVDAEKEKLIATLQAMEDWLYDEGEDVSKSVYISKLDELKQAGAGVEQRFAEAQARPEAVRTLRNTINTYLQFATSDAPQYSHVEASERAQVAKECEAASSWLDEKEALQNLQPKTSEPALLSSDILKRRDTLERVCKPIASKPAPKPAAKAPEPAKAADAGPAPMEADGADATGAAEGEPKVEEMEQ